MWTKALIVVSVLLVVPVANGKKNYRKMFKKLKSEINNCTSNFVCDMTSPQGVHNVECVSPDQVCDGVPDCTNCADERECSTTKTESCDCPAGSYICAGNLATIPIVQYCDGTPDCPAEDDEPGRCICSVDPVTEPSACVTIADGIDNADMNRLLGTIEAIDHAECKKVCCFMENCDGFIMLEGPQGRCALMDTKSWSRLTSNFVAFDGDLENCEIKFYSVLN